MTMKEKVLQAVSNLPDDASIEDTMDHLLFLAKIERVIQQADTGYTILHSEVKERMTLRLK